MSERAAFIAAKRALSFAFERKTNLCEPFLSVLPVTGASVSILSPGQSTVDSSDATAAWIDELQFDLGEGPCWDAIRSRRPVLRAELGMAAQRDWPMFTEAILANERGRDVAALYAFPMLLGSVEIGAVDLYSSTSVPLSGSDVADAVELAAVATWQVLRHLLADSALDEPTPSSRREVHQATGMVLVQLGVGAQEAELLIRAHAFSTGRSVAEVANDIVERRLDFSAENTHGDKL
jgi:hypothetical protein